MTDEAFRETVIRSTQEFRNGGKTYTQEEMRKIAEQ
jgi:hypothetical protein